MRIYEQDTEFDETADPEYDEFEAEFDEAERDEYEDGEFEGELDEFEDGEYAEGEYGQDEMEQYLAELDELEGEFGSPLSEEEEEELVAELLELTDEEELGRMLAPLVSRVGRRFGGPAAKRAGRVLTGMLKKAPGIAHRIARKAGKAMASSSSSRPAGARRKKPPSRRSGHQGRHSAARHGRDRRSGRRHAPHRHGDQRRKHQRHRGGGQGAGRFVRQKVLPWLGQVGTDIVTDVGSDLLHDVLSDTFGVEPAGMSPEEAELETARRFVRLSAAAARNAALAAPDADPQVVARAALLAASRRYAPGIFRQFPMFVADHSDDVPDQPVSSPNGHRPAVRRERPASGRWVRRGSRIIVTGF